MSRLLGTPRRWVQPMSSKPVVVLFSADQWLFYTAQSIIGSDNVELRWRKSLLDLDLEPSSKHVFLVDLDSEHMQCDQLVARLSTHFARGENAVFLLTSGPLSKKWQNLATIYGIKGCITKQGLNDVLPAKLKMVFANDADQRRNERLGIHLPVDFAYLNFKQRATCSSLSRRGAFIQSGFRPHCKARITVEFLDQDNVKQFRTRGSVIYRRPDGFGFRFDMDNEKFFSSLKNRFAHDAQRVGISL